METVRNEFAAMPEVMSVSLSYEIPNGNNGGQPLVYKLGTDSAQSVSMQALVTDENYLDTYRIPLRAGAFFSAHAPDSGKVVLNERAIRVLGYKTPEAAIGGQLRIPGDPTVFTIKGVARDFHFGSMQAPIQPMLFFDAEAVAIYRYLSFKIKPGNVSRSLEAIGKKWAVLLPGSSFEYAFMDDILRKLYQSEIQLERAAYVATLLALVIVLLGVLGLVSVSVQRRVKEIGVRKVLGASIPSIVMLLSKDFLKLVLVAILVASPIAWYAAHRWLQEFAYHIDVAWWIFALAGGVAVGIALLTVSFQSIKAALMNPVKSLRNE
ncbi:MAG TPA: FtsX-like permease family protein, partial [Cytophagales bacterium]